MNLPEIYESDYLNAVERIHKQQSPINHPIFSIMCITTKGYKYRILTDNMDTPYRGDFVILDFKAQVPSFTRGIRYWSLQTKIIIVPDENITY